MNRSKSIKRKRVDIATQTLLKLTLLIYYVAVDALQIYAGYEGGRVAGMTLTCILTLIVFLLLVNGDLDLSMRITWIHLYLIILVLFCLINSLMASYPQTALTRTEQIAKYGLMASVFFVAYDHEDAVNEMLHLIMYGGFLLVLLYVGHYGFDYITKSLASSERITSELINSNTLGMSAAYSCLIYLHYWIQGRFELIGLPLLLLSALVILASQSRKAMLIITIGIALSFMLSKKRKLPTVRSITFLISMIVGVIAIGSFFDLSGFADRLMGLINYLTDGGYVDKSTAMRDSFITVGIKLFKEHPLFGVGVDCSKFYTSYLYGFNYHLHNNYIELLADTGILGPVVYYWIYIMMLVYMLRNRQTSTPADRLCLTLLIIRLVMDYGFYAYKEQSTYLFLVLFAICYESQKSANGKRLSNLDRRSSFEPAVLDKPQGR